MSTTATPTFTIETIERRTKPGLMASLVFDRPATPDRQGWYARVRAADGSAVDVSRMDGEDFWAVDASYGPTGLPGFCNGFGARYLAVRQARPEVAAALDAAAS